MSTGRLLYLSRSDVEAVGVSPGEVIEAVYSSFREKGEGRAEMPPKPGIHPAEDSFLHAMPAYLPGLEAAGIKWIAAYPANRSRGLPYITGLLVLNDPQTGVPLSVMDATWITAMRTAAATAVAVRHLAGASSRTLAILGCGVQGRAHGLLLRQEMKALARIVAYDVRTESTERFREEMAGSSEVAIAGSAEEAVRAGDVVVTAGPILKEPRPVLAMEWLKDGALVCPLDFDSYVLPETFQRVDRLVCDDVPQFLYYRSLGYFKNVPAPDADLGEIVTGNKPGRENDRQRILCASLGLAIEDVAVAKALYERARALGKGTWLEL